MRRGSVVTCRKGKKEVIISASLDSVRGPKQTCGEIKPLALNRTRKRRVDLTQRFR